MEVASRDHEEKVHVGKHFCVSLPLSPLLQEQCVDAAYVARDF